MARDQTGRSRTGDPDDAVPEFVTEHDKPVPICIHCGRDRSKDRPPARHLYTVCPECEAKEFGDLKTRFELTPPVPRHPQGTQAMIHELARDMAMRFSEGDGDHTSLPPAAVLHHEARLMARGVDRTAARRLATAMAMDPSHRATCAVCQANLAEIRAQLEKPAEEVARYTRSGRHHLPRRLGGSTDTNTGGSHSG